MTDLVLPGVASLEQRNLLEMAFAGLSPQTAKLYGGDWKRFLVWAQMGGIAEFFELTKGDAAALVNRYIAHLQRIGRKPATRARARQAICVVVARLYTADVAPWGLAGLVKTPRVRQYQDVEGLAHEAWLTLLQTAQSDGTERGARDVALLLLLHDSALRRREVAGLALEHYDRDKARVGVWQKGTEQDDLTWVPVSQRTMRAIDAWIRCRGTEPGALFTALSSDAPITGDGVSYAVRYWCRKAEIPEVGPHQLRHAAITKLSRDGTPAPELQRFARHQSFDTTMVYVHGTDETVRRLTEQLGEDTDT